MFTILIVTVCLSMSPQVPPKCAVFTPSSKRIYETKEECKKEGLEYGHFLAYSSGAMEGVEYTVAATCIKAAGKEEKGA